MTMKEIRDGVEKRLSENDDTGGGDGVVLDSDFIIQCLNKNELGDGDIFKALHRDHFVFNKAMDGWLYWQGHNWGVDKLGTFALAAVDDVAKVYQGEAKRISKRLQEIGDVSKGSDFFGTMVQLKATLKRLNRRIQALRSDRRRRPCLKFAYSSENPLAIEGDEIDQSPWLMPVGNGVVNLKTGELEQGRQSDFLVRHSDVGWPEDGLDSECPVWEAFLYEVLNDNEDMVRFLQRLLGMALIGQVVVGVFIVFSGRGRNGKGTLIETVMEILSTDPVSGLAGAVRSEMLLDQGRIASSSGPTADIIALRGKRLVTASETDQNCRVSPSRVKWFTGGDTLSGRSPNDKYEVNFKPTHTLILQTNNDPHAPADDYAFWERMIKIPFELSFVNREPEKEFERRADLNLKEKLQVEHSQILAWMVRGCLEFQQVGLKRPAAVKAAVEAYKRDEDLIADFVEECCVVGDEYKVGATAAYERFARWWEYNVSKKVPKMKAFGTLFSKRFKKEKSGSVTYVGVGLLDENGN